MTHSFHTALPVVICLFLSACGGGDAGNKTTLPPSDGTVSSTASFPISSALTAYQQAAHNYTLHATDTAGASYTMSFTQTPQASVAFEGQLASATRIDAVITKAGAFWDQSSVTQYFQSSPYLEIGQVGMGTGTYYVDDISVPRYLPTTAKVNDSGALNNITVYAGPGKSLIVGHQTVLWRVMPDTLSTARLCITILSTPVSGPSFSEADCFRMDTSGNVLGITIDLPVSDTETLLFR
ncbi:MAG TPA: hypothetical protein VFW93_04670 [Aquabacterium sp.]|uniref:hypothetical protein n=1 Tax=Aquabacterium sp. TaxID=1872578 RepID=UPI002E2FD1EB|nr:hypothetical protein [Aquabacterium sp.]HEX5355483.1 hypothetical protein [Aquabacterium sp.]